MEHWDKERLLKAEGRLGICKSGLNDAYMLKQEWNAQKATLWAHWMKHYVLPPPFTSVSPWSSSWFLCIEENHIHFLVLVYWRKSHPPQITSSSALIGKLAEALVWSLVVTEPIGDILNSFNFSVEALNRSWVKSLLGQFTVSLTWELHNTLIQSVHGILSSIHSLIALHGTSSTVKLQPIYGSKALEPTGFYLLFLLFLWGIWLVYLL